MLMHFSQQFSYTSINKNFNEAHEMIDGFIEANPDVALGYYALAQLQMAEGPSVAAINSLTKALD